MNLSVTSLTPALATRPKIRISQTSEEGFVLSLDLPVPVLCCLSFLLAFGRRKFRSQTSDNMDR